MTKSAFPGDDSAPPKTTRCDHVRGLSPADISRAIGLLTASQVGAVIYKRTHRHRARWSPMIIIVANAASVSWLRFRFVNVRGTRGERQVAYDGEKGREREFGESVRRERSRGREGGRTRANECERGREREEKGKEEKVSGIRKLRPGSSLSLSERRVALSAHTNDRERLTSDGIDWFKCCPHSSTLRIYEHAR